MYTPDQTKALQKKTADLTDKNAKKKITAKETEELRNVLRFHEYRYYIMNDPLIADQEYDQLFKALEKLEAQHPEIVTPDSPTHRIAKGLTKDFPTVQHLVPMLSLVDPDSRELYRDWDRKARAVVGNRLLAAGADPDDPGLASLVGRLTMASPEFQALWSDQRVQACATAAYDLQHPLIGALTVTQQTLRSIDQPGQTLVTCTAAPGSDSAAALAMLAHIAYADDAAVQRVERHVDDRLELH